MRWLQPGAPWIILGWVVGLASCRENPSVPAVAISDTPVIELTGYSPETIHQLQDSIRFTIHYTDGNGDLGDYDADTLSLWITDERFPITEKFHIPPLAPAGTTLTIQGTLAVTLDHIILMDPGAASESATFTIRLKDRAGNWSNPVASGPVTIIP